MMGVIRRRILWRIQVWWPKFEFQRFRRLWDFREFWTSKILKNTSFLVSFNAKFYREFEKTHYSQFSTYSPHPKSNSCPKFEFVLLNILVFQVKRMTSTNPLQFMRITSHQIFVRNYWPKDCQEKQEILRELIANNLPKCHADNPHGEHFKRVFRRERLFPGRILIICENDDAASRPTIWS